MAEVPVRSAEPEPAGPGAPDAARALRESEARYRALVRATAQVVWTTDAGGNFVREQPEWEALTGQSFEEYRDAGWVEAIHPDDRARTAEAWGRSVETRSPCEVEYRVRTREGGYRWFRVRAVPVLEEDGSIREWVGTETDVEEERALREALDRERRRLREIFQRAPALIAVVRGPEHVFELANAEYRAAVGGRELIGRPAREAFPDLEGQGFFELLDGVRATGEPFVGQEVLVRYDRDGDGALEEAYFNFVYQPLPGALGEVEGILCHAVEVTQQVEARRQVEEQAAELELANDELQSQAGQLEESQADLESANAGLERANAALVAERREADRERRRAEATLESITDAFFSMDHEWRITYLNAAARGVVQAMMGREPGELIGSVFWEVLPQVVGTRFEAEHRRAAETQEPVTFEEYFEPWGMWIEVRDYPSADGLSVYFRDVTERRRGEAERERLLAEVEAERARLGTVLEHVPVGVLLAEAPTGRIVLGNAQVETLLRHPVLPSPDVEAYGEWVGFHPDGRRVQGREWPLARALEGEVTRGEDFLYQRGDGSRGWIRVSGAPLYGPGGEIVGSVVAISDVDQEHRAAEALHRQAERLRRLADAAVAIGSSTTVRATLEAVAAEARDVLGAARVAVRTTEPAPPEPKEPELGAPALAVPLSGRDGRALGRLEVWMPDEEPSDETGEAVLRQLAQVVAGALENARLMEELREANQTKADFLATMSHELRTPLNAMIGYTDLLEMGVPEPLPERSRQQVRRVGLAARHLLQLIEEILTFSRLEAGRESVQAEDVDLALLLQEVTAIVEPLAAEKGLAFELRREATLGSIRTDPRKLRQVLINLAGNAIKFTDTGRIEVAVSRDGGDAVFEVRDTGVGIAPEHLSLIFEPFRQVETDRAKRAHGTGLGLSVSLRLVRILGGSLSVDSRLGEGSRFVVRLPGAPALATPTGRDA